MRLEDADEILKREILPEEGDEPHYSLLITARAENCVEAGLQDEEGFTVVESDGFFHVLGALVDLAEKVKERNAEIRRNTRPLKAVGDVAT